MKITDVRNIKDTIYGLYLKLEEIGSEDLSYCKCLYSYYCKSARDNSERNNTEGCEEFYGLIENGLSIPEIEYIQVYEEKVYDAWKLIGDSELFKNFCYYMLIKEEMEMFEI